MPVKRTLGLSALTFYGVGIILGAGIYSVLGVAAIRAGDARWPALALVTGLLVALSGAATAATVAISLAGYLRTFLEVPPAFPEQRHPGHVAHLCGAAGRGPGGERKGGAGDVSVRHAATNKEVQ